MKGMLPEDGTCSKCGLTFSPDEFNYDEDLCNSCLFPEMARSLPIELSYAEGEGKNVTTDRKLLDNLDYTPERQSEKAEKSLNKYKNRKLYK